MENTAEKTIKEKSLNILIVSSDWRNIFQTSFDELRKKLERDCLRPELNNFFFYSWANETYYEERDEHFVAQHVKTRWKMFRPFTDFLALFFVPYYVKKHGFKPDVVLVYDFGFIPTANLMRLFYGAKRVLCLTNMPQIYSATRKFGTIKSAYSWIIERAFVSFVDVAYTINKTMSDYMIKVGANPSKVVVFASNTINRDLVHVKNSTKGEVRKKYGIGSDKKLVLAIGRLEAEKGYPRLLELFSSLDSSFVLMILGQGSLLAEFEAKAAALGIRDRVIFVGWVDRTGIWNYYHDADVFVLLSNAEALGLVFWEAMYMGVPVIGSTAEGIVETVGRDGDRGFIMQPTDGADAFKEKITNATAGGKEIEALKERAKEYVVRQISNPVTINEVISRV